MIKANQQLSDEKNDLVGRINNLQESLDKVAKVQQEKQVVEAERDKIIKEKEIVEAERDKIMSENKAAVAKNTTMAGMIQKQN